MQYLLNRFFLFSLLCVCFSMHVVHSCADDRFIVATNTKEWTFFRGKQSLFESNIYYDNKGNHNYSLTLPSNLTQKQKYEALTFVIQQNYKSLNVVYALIQHHGFPIFLSEEKGTIENSLFTELLDRAFMLDGATVQEIVGKQNSAVLCLNDVLDTAKNSLSQKDFFKFTRCARGKCPYEILVNNIATNCSKKKDGQFFY